MSTSDEVRNELKDLLSRQEELLGLVKDFNDLLKFGSAYQNWYSRAYKLVESLAPDRLSEFQGYYLIDPKRKAVDSGNYVIQDYIKGMRARRDGLGGLLWDASVTTAMRILNQLHIIASLSSRIDSVLQDVTGHLFAELQDSELTAATQLKKISKRAAGALAGVVLERHLQRAAINRKVTIGKKNPTIADLNEPLKKAGVYDTPLWRKIQLLADIRNLCSHQKNSEPTEEQVDELIAGVNNVIKSVF